MPWAQLPVDGLLEMLNRLSWQKLGAQSAARDVAALMVYVTMLFARVERARDLDTQHVSADLGFLSVLGPLLEHIAELTYDEMQNATGLSRSLVQQGLDRLVELGRIRFEGSKQKRVYVLTWPAGRWMKLPCRAVFGKQGIAPFKSFTLRSKHELNAMKLYLYLASVRDGKLPYSEASYETIFKRTGISERDIPKAIAILTITGLIARVNRDTDRLKSNWGPNKYYLTGYADFMLPPAR